MRDRWEASVNFQSLSNASLFISFTTQVLYYENVIAVKNCESQKTLKSHESVLVIDGEGLRPKLKILLTILHPHGYLA